MFPKFLLCISCCFIPYIIYGQNSLEQDTVNQKDSVEIVHNFSIEGYIDAYVSIYSDKLPANSFEQFQTVSPRSSHFGVNIIQFALTYRHTWVRSRLSFHYGDMSISSWDPVFNMIQEANVGVHLSKGFWIDAGFFMTHIGTEPIFPKDNLLSSLTLVTYNEPYYQSGFRLTYEGSERFTAAVWLISGYNFFLDKNKDKSVGANASVKISDHVEMGYSGLFGNEQPDSSTIEQFRAYQNLWLEGKWGKFTLLTGVDFGLQTNSKLTNSSELAWMMGGLLTLSMQWNKWFSTTVRGEIFYDPDGFIGGAYINTSNNLEGLEMVGVSVGLSFQPTNFSYIRLEGRWLDDFNGLLVFNEATPKAMRWEGMLTIGAYFSKGFDLAKSKQKKFKTNPRPQGGEILRWF